MIDSKTGMGRRTVLKGGLLLGSGGVGVGAGLATLPGGALAAESTRPVLNISTPANELVDTTAGKVRGYIRNDIHVFKGIPYAETPVGANRFQAPVKPKPWTKPFMALAWGSVCPQPPNAQRDDPAFKWLLEWDTGIQGENCLCLNVWTPSIRDNKKRPVMVWFHGGGFTSGSAQEFPCYDGENIARSGDVVLVSVNHRLNLFGFLNLAGVGGEKYAASGAAGMLDLVAALEWVRDNIAGFGGDPGNVTIFGQSGGGGKVTNLMAMPSARGLFHKAITESGGGFVRRNNRESTERFGAAVATELGLDGKTLSRINDLSVNDLQEVVDRTTALLRQQKVPASMEPLTDGKYILDGEGVPAFSAAIPFMFGGTTHEYAYSLFDPSLEQIDEAGMTAWIDQRYKGKGASIAAEYRKAFPSEKPVEILLRVGAYGFTGAGIIKSSEILTAPGSRTAPAYRFLFDWRTPAIDGHPRAKHNSDIAFAFNNVEKSNPAAAGGAAAMDLGHRMSQAWTSFARTGSPNHAGLPRWEPIGAGKWPTMVFNTPCRVEDMAQSVERRAYV